jgi:hypothetical protein
MAEKSIILYPLKDDKHLMVKDDKLRNVSCCYFAPLAALTGSAFLIIIASGLGARSSSVVVIF